MTDLSVRPFPAAPPEPPQRDAALWQAARALEQGFLSEMLGAAGFGEARQAFGGGAGEEQFSSFLRDAHAKSMVDRGGIGLAEAIYRSMTERTDAG